MTAISRYYDNSYSRVERLTIDDVCESVDELANVWRDVVILFDCQSYKWTVFSSRDAHTSSQKLHLS
jgi:hypothetical protein